MLRLNADLLHQTFGGVSGGSNNELALGSLGKKRADDCVHCGEIPWNIDEDLIESMHKSDPSRRIFRRNRHLKSFLLYEFCAGVTK